MKTLTKAHIKAILHSLFNFHEIWYEYDINKNIVRIWCNDCDKVFYGEK